jgi:ribosomal protein L11 methylase PrmA
MEHTKQMEELNKASLEKLEEFMKTKQEADPEHHEKVASAKEKWQAAWNEFLETLLVLERLEI